MTWWGKVLGGAFGFMIGGPLGAVLGAALGHSFDRGLGAVMEQARLGAGDTERVQTAFFTATFAVMGRLAKADGRVSEHEISLARAVMDRMALDSEQRTLAQNLFREGKRDDFPLEDALAQFRHECHRRRHLIQMFLEIQIMTALADGELDTAEREFLQSVCAQLGVGRTQFEMLLRMVEAQQRFGQAGAGQQSTAAPPRSSLADAYAVLGVSRTASDDEVKKAYRRLMSQHHPDKLVSKGLPEEMMELAKEKTQEIRAAYEQIRNSRSSARARH